MTITSPLVENIEHLARGLGYTHVGNHTGHYHTYTAALWRAFGLDDEHPDFEETSMRLRELEEYFDRKALPRFARGLGRLTRIGC